MKQYMIITELGTTKHKCNCGETAIYGIGYEKVFCFSCASNYTDLHSFICSYCGVVYYLNISSTSKYGLCRECKKDHKDEYQRVSTQNARAISKGLLGILSIGQWLGILKKNEYKCVYCGDKYQEMDHKVPVSKGGNTEKDNVVPCCKKCNCAKKDRIW
jgi:hypothetical protein